MRVSKNHLYRFITGCAAVNMMSCGAAQPPKTNPEPELDPAFVECLTKNVSPPGEHSGPIRWFAGSKYGLLDMWGGPWTRCGLSLMIRMDTPRGLFVRDAEEFSVRIQMHDRPPSRAILCSMGTERRYYLIDEYTVRCGPVGQIYLFFPADVDSDLTRAILPPKGKLCSSTNVFGFLDYRTIESEPVSKRAIFEVIQISEKVFRGWNRTDAPTECELYWNGDFG